MSDIRDLTIPAVDGFQLAATIYEGGERVFIINSATAVPRQFYKSYAQFLCEQGNTVITYDYRGIGDSAPKSLRGFEAKMSEWGLLDMEGVVSWASAELNPSKLIVIGHSIGGQVMGMIPSGDKVDVMITLSAQSGYWGLQGDGERYKTMIQVYTFMPWLTHLLGYFPWSKFAAGLDLPKGVALEWARWCRDPNYVMGDKSLPRDRYQRFNAPVLAYSFDDDVWGTVRSVKNMMGHYPNLFHHHVVPSDYGIKSVGHVGYFRPKSAALWQHTLNWLGEHLNESPTILQTA